MLPGFNHNIKYKDRIFHIQTEDNGEDNPLIISHIFVGGNIIATRKTDYSHLLGKENLYIELKEIMERQHKELIKELITGKFDSHPLVSGAENTEVTQKRDLEAQAVPRDAAPKGTREDTQSSPFKPISTNSNFTIFGEKVVTEETLDKIILRYLEQNREDK
jgi:hypothetical protein